MITFWLWFGVASAQPHSPAQPPYPLNPHRAMAKFRLLVREKVAILQLIHRTEDRAPLTPSDADRFQARQYFSIVENRGAVSHLLESLRDIPVTAVRAEQPSLRLALRQDGYDLDGARAGRRIGLDILDAAAGLKIPDADFVAEVAGYILIHSPMAHHFLTFAAMRAQSDLIALLGRSGAPEALPILEDYLRGLASTSTDVQNTAYFVKAAEALRLIEPAAGDQLIARAIGAPVVRMSPPPPATPGEPPLEFRIPSVPAGGATSASMVLSNLRCDLSLSTALSRGPFLGWIRALRARLARRS